MLAKTLAAAVLGVEAQPIEVEVDLTQGQLPVFMIVGLPDCAVRESKERITAAFSNSGLSLPVRRITVNLAPAELRKVGAAFDLPIAATAPFQMAGRIDAPKAAAEDQDTFRGCVHGVSSLWSCQPALLQTQLACRYASCLHTERSRRSILRNQV